MALFTKSQSALLAAARQRNFLSFGASRIAFPYANAISLERNTNTTGWPVRIRLVQDADVAGTVLLNLSERPAADVLGLTKGLTSKAGTTGRITELDGAPASSYKGTAALLAAVKKATKITVEERREEDITPSSRSVRRLSESVETATKVWGKKFPVLGAVILGKVPGDVEKGIVTFKLYNTPGLRRSLVVNIKGRLVVTNLHPVDAIRIRKLVKLPVRGIRILNSRATTVEGLFGGCSSRMFRGKTIGALRKVGQLAEQHDLETTTVAAAAASGVSKKLSIKKATAAVVVDEDEEIEEVTVVSLKKKAAAPKKKASTDKAITTEGEDEVAPPSKKKRGASPKKKASPTVDIEVTNETQEASVVDEEGFLDDEEESAPKGHTL